MLQRKLADLEAARKRLYSTLNPDQRKEVERSGSTPEACLDIVDHMTFTWTQKSEKGNRTASFVKARFHKCCDGLDQYSVLFKMLPDSSEYVSLFSGALKTVILVRRTTLVPACSTNIDRHLSTTKSWRKGFRM